MRVVLGLGSNLGDRKGNILRAVSFLSERKILKQLRLSSLYECPALLPAGAPASWNLSFFNAALMGETALYPSGMLATLKDLEKRIGRIDSGRWGPRIIDMDILAWGEEQHEEEGLRIPHPGLLQRDFALVPLAELWPEWRHPLQSESTAKEIAARIRTPSLQLVETL